MEALLRKSFYPPAAPSSSPADPPSDAQSHALWLSYPARKRAAVLAILFPLASSPPRAAAPAGTPASPQTAPELGLLLTQRSPKLRVSPSVSAFPGGKVDPADRDDEWACALREAREEVGFDPTAFGASFRKLAISPCYLSLGNDAVRMCICSVGNLGDGGDSNANEKLLQQLRDLWPAVPEYLSRDISTHSSNPDTPPVSVGDAPPEPEFMRRLAPAPSTDEVAIAYAVALKSLLVSRAWYIRGIFMPVAGHEWYFHKYRVPIGQVLGVARAPNVSSAEVASGYHDSDEELEEDEEEEEENEDEEHPKWSTRTPQKLKYSLAETTIPLHGLTSHIALDLARAVYPEIAVPFDVLPHLGSDPIVREYYDANYSSQASL